MSENQSSPDPRVNLDRDIHDGSREEIARWARESIPDAVEIDVYVVNGHARAIASRRATVVGPKLEKVGPVTTTQWALPAPTVVVTRHPALLELLRERGVIAGDARVVEHATPEDVKDAHVIGVLPIDLAALARSVTTISIAMLPEERGRELPIERLREIAGPAVRYCVKVWE